MNLILDHTIFLPGRIARLALRLAFGDICADPEVIRLCSL